jgi:hypothetical protein
LLVLVMTTLPAKPTGTACDEHLPTVTRAGSHSIREIRRWRTHDGADVDLVIERNDGSVVAIEVKAGTRHRQRPRRTARDT